MQMILFIFCDAEEKQLKILRVILILFEATSDLHINWRKSHIFPINEVNRNQQLIEVLGGEIGQLPTIYLGMPLGAKSKVKEIWNGVVERCEKRLSRWKAQYLSKREISFDQFSVRYLANLFDENFPYPSQSRRKN